MRSLLSAAPPHLSRQRGQGMTEYLIITALIAVAAIAVFALFGQTIRDQIAGLTNEVAGNTGTSTEIQSAQSSATKAISNAKQNMNLGSYNKGGNSGS